LVPAAAAVLTPAPGVLAVLCVRLHHTVGSGVHERRLDRGLALQLDQHPRALRLASQLGSPRAVALGALVLALLSLLGHRPRAAFFALVAAPAAGGLTELVLKPLVGRTSAQSSSLAFPSGHTTGASAVALTVVVLLLAWGSRGVLTGISAAVLGLIALAGAAGTALSVVALGWHYASDVVGGVCVAAVVVPGAALLTDGALRLLARARRST